MDPSPVETSDETWSWLTSILAASFMRDPEAEDLAELCLECGLKKP